MLYLLQWYTHALRPFSLPRRTAPALFYILHLRRPYSHLPDLMLDNNTI